MSAWTWTFVKATALPTDEVNTFCEYSIERLKNIWYYKGKDNFEKTLSKWIETVGKSRASYADVYKLPLESITDEFLKRKLIERINTVNSFIVDLSGVKNGKDLNECLKKYVHFLMPIMSRLVNNDAWIKVGEIFRLQEYSEITVEDGIKTIDGLIAYLKEPSRQKLLYWLDDDEKEYQGMSEELEKRIREYYGKYGDGNFSVSFG